MADRRDWTNGTRWGMGVAAGLVIGATLGVALDSIGAGIAVGAGIGVALAIGFGATQDRSGPADGEQPSATQPDGPRGSAAADPSGGDASTASLEQPPRD